MQAIRLAVTAVIGLFLMLVIAANMTPVDLKLLPAVVGVEVYSLSGIPLALVIAMALVGGILLGLLIEFTRAAKNRRRYDEARRELRRLEAENAQLAAKLGLEPGDLAPA